MNDPRHLDEARAPEAPADTFDLLGDLAAEARAERAALEAARGERADAAAQARRRDEALRREALQAELVEETRRRNASRLLTAPEVETVGPATVTRAAAAPEPTLAPAPKRRWMLAAGLLLLVGGGTAALALAQTPSDGIQVDGLVSRANAVGATVVAASMAAREATKPVAAGLPEAPGPAQGEVEPDAGAGVEPEATPAAGGARAPNGETATVKKPTAHRPAVKTPATKQPGITADFDKIYGGGKKK